MSDLVGTPAQVAQALECGEKSVHWLKANAGLPHVYINRKSWVVPWRALDDWLDSQTGRAALTELHTAS